MRLFNLTLRQNQGNLASTMNLFSNVIYSQSLVTITEIRPSMLSVCIVQQWYSECSQIVKPRNASSLACLSALYLTLNDRLQQMIQLLVLHGPDIVASPLFSSFVSQTLELRRDISLLPVHSSEILNNFISIFLRFHIGLCSTE